MNRFAIGAVLLLAGCAGGPSKAAADRPPNILLVLTDDQGWPTLGCYGGRLVPTPHLDRLAAEGIRFTQGYVQPQCTPTRASLLTGQHTARNGMWHVIGGYGYPWARVAEPPFVEQFPRDAFTLARGLRDAGYATGIFGKWHLTRNADGDYNALKPGAAACYGFDVAGPPVPRADFEEGGDRGAGFLTDRTLDFIREHRDRPWFAYLSHHMIHGKVVAPKPLVDKYLALGRPATGLHNATYLAALEQIDRSVGRLTEGLAALGQAERTLVVFLSDNGGIHQVYDVKVPLPHDRPVRLAVEREEYDNAPLRAGKGSAYEGGLRVPWIMRWPGVVRPGRVDATPVHVIDLLPTLLEAAGTRAPAAHPVDGVSLRPLLAGTGGLADRALFWSLPLYDLRWGLTPSAVVRRGDWKLIEFFGDRVAADGTYVPEGALELYNLAEDPGERRERSTEEPRLSAALRSELRAWLGSIPAVIPGPNPHADPSRGLLETNEKPAGR